MSSLILDNAYISATVGCYAKVRRVMKQIKTTFSCIPSLAESNRTRIVNIFCLNFFLELSKCHENETTLYKVFQKSVLCQMCKKSNKR